MWNSADLKNSSKGAQILFNYEKHKKAISQIKTGKLRIDNSKPFCPKFIKSPYYFSRPYQSYQIQNKSSILDTMRKISEENKKLVQKVNQIQAKDSKKKVNDEYCKQYVGKNSIKYQMSLNIEHRINALKQIMNENQVILLLSQNQQSIEKRIQQTQPIISKQALQNDYEKHQQYKCQILNTLARNTNCMLTLQPNSSTLPNFLDKQSRVQTTTNTRRRSQFQIYQNQKRPQTRQLNNNPNSQSYNTFNDLTQKVV